MLASDRNHDFGRLLRSAGALGLGRQMGGLIFMVAVLALPAVAPRAVVDDFIWVYFASLFLTSILNLGLERIVAPLVAANPEKPLPAVVRPVLRARFWSLPVTIGALWAMFRFVGVSLPPAAWLLSLTWIAAVQVQGIAFSALRAGSRVRLEPRLALGSRVAEAFVLLGLAAGGATITALVGAMAAAEVGVAVLAVRAVGSRNVEPIVGPTPLPWKTVSLYATVELLAFAYLRVDTVLVGHILGPGPGATYGLIYRVIDALMGLTTPLLLLLFPYAASLVATGTGLKAVRERVQLLPGAAAVLAVVALLGVAPFAAIVPRFGEGADALRILLVAVPLYVSSAIELHLRSAEGRNGEVVAIGAGVLVLNVVLNLVLIPAFGLVGAAWALTLTEGSQLLVILLVLNKQDPTLGRSGMAVVGYAMGVLCVAILVNSGRPVPGALLAVVLVTSITRVSLNLNRRHLAT